MKPAAFNYFDPASPDEALALLQEWGEDGKVLAGGQTLGPMLNFRALAPAALIDINGLDSLAHHSHTPAGTMIGALTRQRALEDDKELPARQPLVAATIPYIAHRAIRNRGTVGGSLAHADPAAEWGALILTLQADLVVRTYRKPDRVVAARDFFRGMLETALAPTDMLVEIRLPPWPRGAGWGIVEFSRRHGDFALAGVASMIALAADGTCSDVRLSGFGVGTRALRLTRAEKELRGNRPSPALVQEAARRAAAEVSPLDDNHASAAYRRHLTGVLVERALGEAIGRSAAHLH
jgi:aerobic carbon-monoxide dehydrogenase medium subunit